MTKSSFYIAILLTIQGMAWATNCQQKTTSIAGIQGTLKKSPLIAETVWVKGIVTGDFRGKNALGGFFIQSLNPDQSPVSSEGLFIHDNNQSLVFNVGDLVVLKGQVSEKFDVTQLTSVSELETCQVGNSLPSPVSLSLPTTNDQLEALEGMRVTFAEPYTVTDVFNYVRFGELVVSSKILMSPTALHRPGPEAKLQSQIINNNQITVDDGRMDQYPTPFAAGSRGESPINAKTAIQLGQQIQTTGVMHYAFGKYKLQPTTELSLGAALPSSQLIPQDPGGQFKVAAFNVENFFTTIDNGQEICGPLKNFGCRGADSAAELERQLAKLVAVINTANASVMGLQELENNAKASTVALVDGLNHDAGYHKWDYIDTGVLGEDVIKVGLIYQPDQLKPQGSFALLNSQSDAEFLENKNRVVVAQTFKSPQGQTFNVATVHFKSKSCRDAAGIFLDQKDGQGCYNPTRTQVANQVARWLIKDPTEQGAKATFIVGDFNSYQFEDPMIALKKQGFNNLAAKYLSATNWTTSYRGTVGSLDYVLANAAAQNISTGLTQWHINSVSMKAFGYNTEAFDERIQKPDNFYQVDPFASSDHDVVMAGFSW